MGQYETMSDAFNKSRRSYALEHVMRREANAIRDAIPHLYPYWGPALRTLEGKDILFFGVGKSGAIAQKAASTFRSFGIPAHYLHPSEGSHGDFGAITSTKVIVALSNSGNTRELSDMIHFAKSRSVPIVGITSNASSDLARASTAKLIYGTVEEADPMGLAPTTSTAVMLAVCDALAVDLAMIGGITREKFREHHPGGSLGEMLKTAADLMKSPVPIVHLTDRVFDAALVMTGDISGIAVVYDYKGGLLRGVVTDGDIRRAVMNPDMMEHPWTLCVQEIIRDGPPVACSPETPRDEVRSIMDRERITKLLVCDDSGKVVGVVNRHDV